MNDNRKIQYYYEAKLKEAPDLPPPVERIKSIADSAVRRPASKWETLFGLMVTLGYLLYFINPYNWFSLGRFVLAFTNGFSFGRLMFVFNIGF